MRVRSARKCEGVEGTAPAELVALLVLAAAPAVVAQDEHDERDDERDAEQDGAPEDEHLEQRRHERVDARVHVDCEIQATRHNAKYSIQLYMALHVAALN